MGFSAPGLALPSFPGVVKLDLEPGSTVCSAFWHNSLSVAGVVVCAAFLPIFGCGFFSGWQFERLVPELLARHSLLAVVL